jgi:hypothetical protein
LLNFGFLDEGGKVSSLSNRYTKILSHSDIPLAIYQALIFKKLHGPDVL